MAITLGDFYCVYTAGDTSSITPFRDRSTVILNEIVNKYWLEDVGDVIEGTKCDIYIYSFSMV